uniref:Uncharacterized protein MANES_13G095500 n=1 Tax=Rhizophora mucronata TaxID=61149 RepID=A0A2P2KTZ8_RHIMU
MKHTIRSTKVLQGRIGSLHRLQANHILVHAFKVTNKRESISNTTLLIPLFMKQERCFLEEGTRKSWQVVTN